jgi:hypothetical protein
MLRLRVDFGKIEGPNCKMSEIRISSLACVCFTIGNVAPELLFEDLQDQTFEESQLFFADQQGKSP